jgi:hypothetical protein
MSAFLDRFMAEKLLGCGYTKGFLIDDLRKTDDEFVKWRPTKDMNQAVTCAEKYADKYGAEGCLDISIGLRGWDAYIYDDCGEQVVAINEKTAPLAICQAIAEAIDV